MSSITVVSAVRLEYLIQFADTENVTWDYLPIGYWSAVETHVSVIIACLPSVRLLQRSIRERLWPKPASSTGYYGDNTRDSRKNNSSKIPTSRKWTSKTSRSGMSTLRRSGEDFVRLEEYGTRDGAGIERFANDEKVTASCSPGTPVPLSDGSNEDDMPLVGGILVRKEYSVDDFNYDTITAERGQRRGR